MVALTLTAGHLVGRTKELGLLDELLAELDHNHAAALELVGEPGIGKTRLLAELGARADLRGWLVLSGSGSELERDLPFSVFVDALDQYLRGLEPSSLACLNEGVQAELAHIFPSLSALVTTGNVALQHERYRAHRAVRALLEHLAQTRPLVLVLDDLHWADAASIELLGALLRRPPATAVLIAMAVRPRQVLERLSAALERAHRAGALARIELGALTPAQARQFLGETVDAADAAILYQESGGNPFYLEQLARSLASEGGAATASQISLTDIGVPSAVAASLSEELDVLSATGRLVLQGAAVAGDPFEPELAAAAAAMSDAEAMDAIDELLQVDLIRNTEVPRRFRFRHPLVRRAVYGASSGAWRLRAHERCAKALEAWAATPAARAHHVERSAREGDAAAVTVLRQAGEASVRLAPESAARWFAGALRLLLPAAPAQERAELLLSRANALTAAGRIAESHDVLLDGLAIVPKQAVGLHATFTRACASVELLLGHVEQAYARLADELDDLPEPDSPEAVALMIELALDAGYKANYETMQEWAGRATSTAKLLNDAPLTAAAAAMLMFANTLTDSYEGTDAEHSDVVALVEALSDDQLARHLDAAAWLAFAELHLDRYAEAAAHAERALTLGRASGRGDALVFVLLYQVLGRAWYVSGRLAEAGDLLDGAIEAARLMGNTHALGWNLFNRSVVSLAVGDVEAALASAQESVDLSQDIDEGFVSAWAAVRLAAVLLETGQPARAAELLLSSAGGEELTLIPGSWRAHCLELLTRCWLELDRPAEAERSAASAKGWASAVRVPLAASWADRATAATRLYADDPSGAAEYALASAATADEAQAPIEAALSRILLGRALDQAGERDGAIAELRRASTALDSCGALRYRDQAERELRKLGHRIHRRTRRGKADGNRIESLTERELQLARLVVDRKTNPQIAAELYLSQKTVETHLRNIFRKVNVTSRVALARAVERADREGYR